MPKEEGAERLTRTFFGTMTMTATVLSNAPAAAAAWSEAPTPVVYDVSSPEFVDHFCEGLEEEDFAEEEEETSTSVWHLLSTFYLWILFIKLRRFFCGVANLIRSLLLGQCLRFLAIFLAPTWWESFSHQTQALFHPSGKTDPHAWPPATLTLLAILTVVAFIVHPDGMTWIVLRKLRNCILGLLQSSTVCWNLLVEDYGIIPTVTAVATLASLVLLGLVLYRLSSPRPKQLVSPPQKKKKRKPHKGRGRIKNKRQQEQPKRFAVDQTIEEEAATTDLSCEVACGKSDFLPTQLMSETLPRPRVLTADTALMDDQSVESSSLRSTTSLPLNAVAKTCEEDRETFAPINTRRADFLPKDLTTMQEPTRPRALTADTALMDDHTIESASTVSVPVKTPQEEKKPARTPNRRRGNQKRGKNKKALDASDATPPNKSHRSRQSATSNARRLSLDASADTSVFSTRSPSTAPTHTRSATMSPTSSLFSHEPIASFNPNTPTAGYGIAHGVNNASISNYYSTSPVNPEKLELAAFLAQVGLLGTVASDLLEDFDNVDALSRLSDAQFELYNVTPDKQARIDVMLHARARGGSSVCNPPIRPPPGLGVKNDQLLLSPPRLNHGYDVRKSNFGYNVGLSHQSLGGTNLQLPSLLQSYNVSNSSLDDEEDQIEADLQKLGGQMVGSILDFEG